MGVIPHTRSAEENRPEAMTFLPYQCAQALVNTKIRFHVIKPRVVVLFVSRDFYNSVSDVLVAESKQLLSMDDPTLG